MVQMVKLPDYRFKNYTNYWEQRQFKEYTKLSQGLQIAIADRFLEDGENRYFYITNEFLNPNSDKKYYIESPSKNVLCSKRDILMTRTGNTGKVVTDIEGAFHNNFFKVDYDSKESSKLFLFHLLNSPKIQKELLVRAGNSTIPDLNHNDFYSIKTMIPSLPEQTAIGSFFQDIDQLISLQKRKLEVLKEQKKTYLKLLFPAKGQAKPALRFAGFEDDWKEVKLGEIADRYDNLRVPVSANERVSGDTPYYGANGIQDYVDGYTHDGEFILIAEDGASDLKDYPVQYVNGKVWVNNHAHVIQGKNDLINNMFLLFAVKQINIEPFLVGGGRAKLNSDIMMKLPLHLPPLPEQEAIGSFFQDLDKAIAKQEEKVNQLKESKQTLLRKMFI